MKKPTRHPSGRSAGEVRQLLEQAGLRKTASRVAVLQLLAGASAPLTHAHVADQLEAAGFGAPTVFRCLNDLAEVGLAVRVDLGDHVWRFAFHEPSQAEHAHFVCVDCGKATCLPDQGIRLPSAGKGGMLDIGDVTEVILKGHCKDCRE
jgi:Fur family ferric uptake transcriptional regulator